MCLILTLLYTSSCCCISCGLLNEPTGLPIITPRICVPPRGRARITSRPQSSVRGLASAARRKLQVPQILQNFCSEPAAFAPLSAAPWANDAGTDQWDRPGPGPGALGPANFGGAARYLSQSKNGLQCHPAGSHRK